jgi:hypothetical protein
MMHASLLALSMLVAEVPASPALPAEWHGRWTGTLKITPVSGAPQETVMEMVIEPLKDSKNYRWKIVYGDGKKAPVRDYELAPQEKANHFVIDEKNGLLIDAWLVGKTMHSQFQVGDSMIPVRYELKSDTLLFSLAVYGAKDARTTKLMKGDTEVKAYRLMTVQSAELRKAKSE